MGRQHHWAVIAGAAMFIGCAAGCGAAAAASVQTKSDIKGVALVPLTTLPRSPGNGSLEPYCEGYRAEKLTSVAQQVARLGWIVTSEAAFGRYRVVTFASGFDRGTSAMCFARNPNIGVFENARLVALAYNSAPLPCATEPSRRACSPRSTIQPLGVAAPLEGGALLIWSDPPGAPMGELRQDAGGLRLTAVAGRRTFCQGQAAVPNLYDKSIAAARKVLIAHGWRPMRPKEKPGEYDAAADLAKRGVVEAASCSGTGVGYCGFDYRGPAGVLHVTTVGGDPDPAEDTVVSYDVECGAK